GHLAVALVEVVQHVGPRAGGPRRGALGQVAEDGRRTVAAAPSQCAELHGRQVLRLVHDEVPQRGRAFDEVGQLVQERGVGGRPSGGPPRTGGFGPRQQFALLFGEVGAGGGGEEGGVGQQPVEDLLGGELGPYLVDELPDRPRAG